MIGLLSACNLLSNTRRRSASSSRHVCSLTCRATYLANPTSRPSLLSLSIPTSSSSTVELGPRVTATHTYIHTRLTLNAPRRRWLWRRLRRMLSLNSGVRQVVGLAMPGQPTASLHAVESPPPTSGSLSILLQRHFVAYPNARLPLPRRFARQARLGD